MATKKQGAAEAGQEVSAAEEVAITGDGTGEALPEASQEMREAAAPAERDGWVDALVLCTTSGYPAGAVLEGVPEEVAMANQHWLDPHPAAVGHARAAGAPAIVYGD